MEVRTNLAYSLALVILLGCIAFIDDVVISSSGLNFERTSNATASNRTTNGSRKKNASSELILPFASTNETASSPAADTSILLDALPDLFLQRVIGRNNNNNNTTRNVTSAYTSSIATQYLFPDGSPDKYPQKQWDLMWIRRNNNGTGVQKIDDAMTSALVASSCSVTSQVRIFVPQNATTWILQSLDGTGTPKTMGGDEYHIIYIDDNLGEGANRAVAYIKDHANGLYELSFTKGPLVDVNSPFNGTGRLDIYLEWSCGLGLVPPPWKQDWFTGGMINAYWNRTNIPAPSHLRVWENPNTGRFKLRQFQHVVNVGDSTLVQFVSRNYCMKTYKHNVRCMRPVYIPYYMQTRNVTLATIHTAANHLTQENVALILNANAWDILADTDALMGRDMLEFEKTATALITELRQIYPNATIFWKSGSALHPHRLLYYTPTEKEPHWYNVERGTYMSNSRALLHYELEKKLMEQLQVPFLDLFDFTFLSANRHKSPSDALHYSQPMNRIMSNWFY